jgi:hypothetical protein
MTIFKTHLRTKGNVVLSKFNSLGINTNVYLFLSLQQLKTKCYASSQMYKLILINIYFVVFWKRGHETEYTTGLEDRPHKFSDELML